MERVVGFIDSAFKLAVEVQEVSGPKLVDFKREVASPSSQAKVANIRGRVEAFAGGFRLPGHPEI